MTTRPARRRRPGARRIGAAAVVVLVATGVMVLLLGILPGTFLHFARDAASLI